MTFLNKNNFNNYTHSPQTNHLECNDQSYNFPCSNGYKWRRYSPSSSQQIKDYGPYPFAVNLEEITENNNTFRSTLWTGQFMQLTLMSLLPGEEIGLEMHNDLDQFIRIEQGTGNVMMGDNPDTLNFQQAVSDGYAFIIPAGKWHNLINIGLTPLKLYSIYAPPQHPFGTVHETKAVADEAEH